MNTKKVQTCKDSSDWITVLSVYEATLPKTTRETRFRKSCITSFTIENYNGLEIEVGVAGGGTIHFTSRECSESVMNQLAKELRDL